MSGFQPTFLIGDIPVGGDAPVLVIAEAGVAHFGDLGKAFELVDLAAEAQADVLKIQVYDTDRLVASVSPEWQDRLRPKELTREQVVQVRQRCQERGILFMATGHEEQAIDFLDRELDVPAFKIGSGEVENWPLLRDVARRGKPIILSTGMYRPEQIDEAISVIAAEGCRELALLHCVTLYPTPPELVNLRVIQTLTERFAGPVGYSDHTQGTAIPLAAVALGARVIEKHVTMDVDIPNAQDWKVSCTPENLAQFVADIRAVERSLGQGTKHVGEAESRSIAWARKSLFAARNISRGEPLEAGMLVSLRPGTGIPPSALESLLGAVAARDIPEGSMLQPEDLVDD